MAEELKDEIINEEEAAETVETAVDEKIGRVEISEQVVGIIAGIAATEIEGVSSIAGDITAELVSKIGIKTLAKGIKITMINPKTVTVDVTLSLIYGYSIPEVCKKVQERISSSIETMTGISVAEVNISIVDVIVRK